MICLSFHEAYFSCLYVYLSPYLFFRARYGKKTLLSDLPLAFFVIASYRHGSRNFNNGGALVSTKIDDTAIAGRGAAGLVKSGTIVIGNDYEYAYAA